MQKPFAEALKSMSEADKNERTDVRILGKIVKLSQNGWGFIQSPEHYPFVNIYFRWTALVQNTLKFTKLERGMEVEFTPAPTPHNEGYRALRVKVTNVKAKTEGLPAESELPIKPPTDSSE